MGNKISARIELDEYSNRVLSMIKAKYGLKDKSQAINQFILIHGEDILEREATDEYIKKVKAIAEKHFKKYRNKKMSEQELDKLFERQNV